MKFTIIVKKFTGLGYIFSVCPLPQDSTTESTYLLLLALYIKFMALLRWDEIPTMRDPCHSWRVQLWEHLPLMVDLRPSPSGLHFGWKDQKKQNCKNFREVQLRDTYHQDDFPATNELQRYGNCAETYPYIFYLSRYVSITYHVLPFFFIQIIF